MLKQSSSGPEKTSLDNVSVCVVLPFYNAQETLRNAVFSVLNQSYFSWQLILLNDGSVDNSVDTISDLVDNDSVFLFSDKTNRGLIYRLNQMVELTDAPFIARMDADDLMHPDRLRLQMEAFRADSQLDIVSTGMAIMNSDYRVVVFGVWMDSPHYPTILSTAAWFMLHVFFAENFLKRTDMIPYTLGQKTADCFCEDCLMPIIIV